MRGQLFDPGIFFIALTNFPAVISLPDNSSIRFSKGIAFYIFAVSYGICYLKLTVAYKTQSISEARRKYFAIIKYAIQVKSYIFMFCYIGFYGDGF